MSCSKLLLPEIGDTAHQPLNFSFPQREFGKSSVVKCSFQAQWFQWWPWLHYDVNRDQAFCFSCVMAYKNNYLHSTSCLEKFFIYTGFNCWKDAIAKFTKHKCSQSHKDAVLKTITLPSTSRADYKTSIRGEPTTEMFPQAVVKCSLFSKAQGLACSDDGEESNFIRLLYLRAEDNGMLLVWTKQKANKYTSCDMQNEIVKVMSTHIL